jgi:hypothetical protein
MASIMETMDDHWCNISSLLEKIQNLCSSFVFPVLFFSFIFSVKKCQRITISPYENLRSASHNLTIINTFHKQKFEHHNQRFYNNQESQVYISQEQKKII